MHLAGWFIVLMAIIFANLPFLNQRLLAIVPLRGQRKPFGWRLAELIILYLMVGLLSCTLEARLGNVFHQGWQFYAITFSLFLVFAFPGFTFCYLVRHQ